MKNLWQKLDAKSLKVRLTLGIALFSTLGVGGLAAWVSVRMQYILVTTHKENIEYIAERFPQDVAVYSDMVTLEEGMQRAIDNLSDETKLLWVKNQNQDITARSQLLQQSEIGDVLLPLKNVPAIPQVQDLSGRYWLMCATPLEVNGVTLGKFYIAQDITQDHKMLLRLLKSLTIATAIATMVMTTVIALYINRSLRPLKKISQLTANISADKLAEARIPLQDPPSEVKELADTFEEMLLRLSESWEHQRQLLSNVSHELRTPLAIICGYIESTLRRGHNLTEIQREALTTAASEADNTVQLLQDLLDLARADSGAMHFTLEPVELSGAIAEVVNMAQQYSNHQFIVQNTEAKCLTITADPKRLKQVLLNLVDNAIKYSAPAEPITLSTTANKQHTKIIISDRGVGIPLQQQARIFERFYRLDEARNRAGGTGLGLSIVKTLVEGMGGTIEVNSRPGVGSSFILSFPTA